MTQDSLIDEVLILLESPYLCEFLLLLCASNLSDVPDLHRLQYLLIFLSLLIISLVDIPYVRLNVVEPFQVVRVFFTMDLLMDNIP